MLANVFTCEKTNLLINILLRTRYTIKNKEKMKFPGYFCKYGRAYITPGYFFSH
jgi:hypothetical protein